MPRDINRALGQVERILEHVLDRSKPSKNETPKTKSPTIRAWRAPASDHLQYPEPKARSIFRENINVTKLSVTARAMKVSVPLDPAAVSTLPLPNRERVELAVGCDGQWYITSISTKSLRKARRQWCGRRVCYVARQIEGPRNYRMWFCCAGKDYKFKTTTNPLMSSNRRTNYE
jgi:hypothetical protein